MKFSIQHVRLFIGFFLAMMANLAVAQPPGPGPGRMDMADMVNREKQTLYKTLTDLTEDQKLLLDGIYDEFALTMKQNMEEMRENRGSGDPETMRTKMEALHEEKNNLIKDVLNEDQFAIYMEQMESAFGQRKGKRGQGPPPNRADSTSTGN